MAHRFASLPADMAGGGGGGGGGVSAGLYTGHCLDGTTKLMCIWYV